MNDIVDYSSGRLSFSKKWPNLQLAWDSVSLGLLKECPRKYQYSILMGYFPRAENVHLTFGLHYHKILEFYDHKRAEGMGYEEAVLATVRFGMEVTWDKELRRPWFSDMKEKNRFTLIRTIVWYLDEFKEDQMKTIVLANGKPAVELSFRYELGWTSFTEEPFLAAGHMDRMAVHQDTDETWVLDRKTTKHALDQKYFAQYRPDSQMSGYTVGGRVIYNVPVKGVMIDATQILVTLSRFSRQPTLRTDGEINEWLHDFQYYTLLAQGFAKQDYWPMNDKSCGNYGGCPYRGICSKDPKVRLQWLKGDMGKRSWDPLVIRGDI